jgi:FkbM family methyltransferase
MIFDRLIKRSKTVNSINPLLFRHISSLKNITLYDIGAHKGLFSKNVSNQFHIERGILVEPIKENYEIIQKYFNSENFIVYNNVVTDSDNKMFHFNINKFDETSSILKIKNGIKELISVDTELSKEIEIESVTLDSITKKNNIEKIDLIKIDVQGVEDKVLKGALYTLQRTKYVWVETSFKSLYDDSALFSDIYNIMNSNDFIMVEISPGYRDAAKGELLQADVLFKSSFLK